MLAAFRFRNFRSFRDQAEFSLVAQKADHTHPLALLNPRPSSRSALRLLPAAVIYGPNAAGKTNVLKALRFMRIAVMRSQSSWSPLRNVLTDQNLSNRRSGESAFEVEFFIDGIRYEYGFAASKKAFVEEWLFSFPNSRKCKVFERYTDKSGEIQVEIGEKYNKNRRKISGTISRVRPNSLFVSAAAQDNHPLALEVYKFFKSFLFGSIETSPESARQLSSALLANGGPLSDMMFTILQQADPNISKINVDVEGDIEGDDDDNDEASLDRRYSVSFTMGEGKNCFEIDLEQQSDGIRRLYDLLGEISGSLVVREVLLIDEIEASLHPIVARLIVDLFQSKETNPLGSQVIFTTHDTGLLDQTLLRRDQIWFVEKDACCSKLYPLTKFSPRRDADLERGYLRGRYGAIPTGERSINWLIQASSNDVSVNGLEQP